MRNLTAITIIIIPIIILGCGSAYGQGDGSWSTNAAMYRGLIGLHIAIHCPATKLVPPVWGTDIYTDDSSICAAGVHAGVITPERGGTVTVEIKRGAQKYLGSRRNDIDSFGYGEWDGSFAVVVSKRKKAYKETPCLAVLSVGVK